jgi:hypothetical protein
MVHSLVATAVSSSLATVAFMNVVAAIAAIMTPGQKHHRVGQLDNAYGRFSPHTCGHVAGLRR